MDAQHVPTLGARTLVANTFGATAETTFLKRRRLDVTLASDSSSSAAGIDLASLLELGTVGVDGWSEQHEEEAKFCQGQDEKVLILC